MAAENRIPILDNDFLYRVELRTEHYILYQSLYDQTFYLHSLVENDGFKFFPCKRECYSGLLKSSDYIPLRKMQTYINCRIPDNVENVKEYNINCELRIDH